ncbi:MAG: NAD(P)/FAD-dependent oxidoreductase [Candidatus Omnitrophota bacterium]
MDKADVVIIGSGIVGLSCAYELAKKRRNVVLIEKHPDFGQEISSRNSEVIHSGIYYEKDSFKARFCVEGNGLIYEFCRKNNVHYERLGKLIVAVNKNQLNILEKLYEKGRNNGVKGLELITERNLRHLEPNVSAVGALHSPATGIFDSHGFMAKLKRFCSEDGVVLAYSCCVYKIEKQHNGYRLCVKDSGGGDESVFAEIVINSAGLNSEKIAALIGLDTEKAAYKLHYSKGEYFRVNSKKSGLLKRLIYPVPGLDSLGIHTVPDLQGQLRLGPNAEYVENLNYDVNLSHRDDFYNSVKGYLPFIEKDDLCPDIAGIRPKLQGPGEGGRDFVVSEETDKDLPGFINLIGIESPGLTSSLAIAKYVSNMIR